MNTAILSDIFRSHVDLLGPRRHLIVSLAEAMGVELGRSHWIFSEGEEKVIESISQFERNPRLYFKNTHSELKRYVVFLLFAAFERNLKARFSRLVISTSDLALRAWINAKASKYHIDVLARLISGDDPSATSDVKDFNVCIAGAFYSARNDNLNLFIQMSQPEWGFPAAYKNGRIKVFGPEVGPLIKDDELGEEPNCFPGNGDPMDDPAAVRSNCS